MIHSAARYRLAAVKAILGGAALLVGCDQAQLGLPPQAFTPNLQAETDRSACAELSKEDVLLRDLVDAINAERQKAGVAPVRVNPALMLAADFFACRLIDGDFFDHVDPFDGTSADDRALDFGYPFTKIGENLAAGQQAPKEVVADWMSSPKHRRNMLDPVFTDVGVAGKDGGRFVRYWVLELGRPMPLGASPERSNSAAPAAPTTAAQSQPAP